MESQKELLKSILQNQLDRANLLSNLRKYKVSFDEESSFVILKYKLKLKLLENISHGDCDVNERVDIDRMKKETEEFLKFHNEKLSRVKFKCTLAGCLFECGKHRDYIRHLQRVHPQETNLGCQYGFICKSAFASISLLKEHITHAHQSKSANTPGDLPALLLEVPCRCSIPKCGGAQFSSLKVLMLHLQNFHAKAGEMVSCIYEKCSSKYDNAGSLRVHFQTKHLKKRLCNLKLVNKVLRDQSPHPTSYDDLVIASPDIEPNVVESEELHSVNESQEDQEHDGEADDEHQERDGHEDIDEVFMMAYCDFLNRLLNFQFIPQSSIQLISEEFLKNYLKSNEAKSAVLRSSLLKNIPGISETDIQKVLGDVAENDSFLGAQKSLDTEYKRLQYLKRNFTFVEPVEIIFNPKEVKEENQKKAVMHYIPLIQTVKNLVEDSTFLEVTEAHSDHNPECLLRDVKDGSLFKNNRYFLENPEALTILLYSDGVEVVNPLGAGRGKHKVIQIFLTFGEIPKTQRSKIDRIQLVAIVKEKVVKQFGFKKVYHQIVEDLKELERGIIVHHPVQRLVKCGLLLHPADNLEAHGVGGFSQSFSSLDVCRFCHVQYKDLQENIHNYGSKQHCKWTIEEYDKAAQEAEKKDKSKNAAIYDDDSSEDSEEELGSSDDDALELSDEEAPEMFGIKHRCPLNSLQAFHCTSGFPPDILHDILGKPSKLIYS